ncbi:MAG: hypothetical protein RIB84_00100 [Sneathiellaceae bacterium]
MTNMEQDSQTSGPAKAAGKVSRRAALSRLGLGAAAVYAAPTVTRIDQARAAAPSHSCPPGAPGCGGGPPGRP